MLQKISLYLFLFATTFIYGALNAQIAVSVSNPSNVNPAMQSTYASFAEALTALNASSEITGPIALNLASGSTEIAPAGGFILSFLNGSSATNTISISGQGAGNKPILQASPEHVSGSRGDAVLKLIGSDHVIINNIEINENELNTNYILASNSATEFGIALLYASATNGCKHIQIQDCTIRLNRLYINSVGIYGNVRHNASAPQSTSDITSIGGAQEFITISSNQISDVALPIVLVGSTNNNFMVGNITIGGSETTGNTITNWGSTAAPNASYASVSGTVYGIYVNNYKGMDISHNTVVSAALSVTSTFRGIFLDYSGTPSGVYTNSIHHNVVSTLNSSSSSTYRGIDVNDGNNAATAEITENFIINSSSNGAYTAIFNSGNYNTLRINNNRISGHSHTGNSGTVTGIANAGNVTNLIEISGNTFGTDEEAWVSFSNASSGLLSGITNTAGSASTSFEVKNNSFYTSQYNAMNTGSTVFISNSIGMGNQIYENNTFHSISINSTGGATCLALAGNVPANGSKRVENNRIINQFSKTGSGGSVIFISGSGSSQAGAQITVTGNVCENVQLTGSTSFNGITDTDGGSANKSFTNNIIRTISAGGTSNIINVNNGGSAGGIGNEISGNIVENITNTGATTGINLGSSGSNASVFNNIIRNITSSSSTLNGISSATSNVSSIYNNSISKLTNTGTSGIVNGINVTGGNSQTIYNNRIAELFSPNASAANPLNGINISGGSSVNIYYNTVLINAISSGGTFGSSAIVSNSTPSLLLRNNIFINLSTPNGSSGRTVAYRRTNTNLTTYNTQSNNNLYFSGETGPQRFLFFDGTNADVTLEEFQTRVSPRDALSVIENTSFLSTDGDEVNFLKIDSSISTLAESGAVNIAGISTDFEGDIRQGNEGYTGGDSAPDIGADEFNSVIQNCSGTPIAGAIQIDSDLPVCEGETVVLNLIGASNELGISYQWQFSASPGGPYINGGTNQNEELANLNSDLFYICEIICNNSGESAFTEEVFIDVRPLPSNEFSISYSSATNELIAEYTPVDDESVNWIIYGEATDTLFSESFIVDVPIEFQQGIVYFELEVTNECGSVNAIDSVFTLITAIAESQQDILWNIFPNPIDDNVKIRFNEIVSGELKLMDLSGRVIEVIKLHENSHEVKLNFNHLSPGMYYFVFTDSANRMMYRKITKK